MTDLTTTTPDLTPWENRVQDTRGRVDAIGPQPSPGSLVDNLLCACATIDLVDEDETRPDADEDELLHGAAMCGRWASADLTPSYADALDVFAALVREVDAGRALIAAMPATDRKTAAVDALALARDVLDDAYRRMGAGL